MKKIAATLLAFLMIVNVLIVAIPEDGIGDLFITAYAANSGTCGDNLTWVLDDKGTLTISGTGAMTDWAYYSGAPWYSDPSSIKSIVIDNSVTSIGIYAFAGCDSLISITVPNSVTSIGEFAFRNCSSLENITIPDSVTSIGNSAFLYCSSLKSVTIGNSVTSIGEDAFYGCSSLENITIPDSVTSIGNSAFLYCSSLKSVTIGNSVTSIGEDAFYGCSSLENITIPDSVTSIGGDAFYGCSSLTGVYISDITAWCGVSFSDLFSNPLYFAYAKNLYLNGNLVKDLVIPDSVTGIGDYAFTYCSSLESVTIGNGVTSIGYAAFWCCSSLKSVTIPDSVTSIGDLAFYDCSSLTSINVDKDNLYYCSIDEVLFNKTATTLVTCPGGKSGDYTIPDSVTDIGSHAFSFCSSLESITIGSSVTSIGDYAFSSCSSLKSITIPDSVTSIGESVFSRCRSLESITIPDSVTDIGEYAFFDCNSLTSVTIPDSVTRIGRCTFYCCESLTSITIPDSVTKIGEHAFWGCSSLESVTIPNSVTSIGESVFSRCRSLKEVYISDIAAWCGISFGHVYSNPLYYAKNLYLNGNLVTDLVIPDSVTRIGRCTFYCCESLTSITIPDSVTKIGEHAFWGCSSLSDVYYSGSESDWSKITIGSYNSCLTGATIHYNWTPTDWSDTVTIEVRDANTGSLILDGSGYFTSDTINFGDETFFEINGDAVSGHTEKNFIFWSSWTGSMIVTRDYFPLHISTTYNDYKTLNLTDVACPSGSKLIVYLTAKNSTEEGWVDTSTTTTKGPDEFDMDIYRADHDINSDTTALYRFNDISTCQLFVDELQKNGFSTTAGAWEALTTSFDAISDPTIMLDKAVEEKDLYMAIILDALETTSSLGLTDSWKKVVKDNKEITSIVADTMKTYYDINVYDWNAVKNMSATQRDKFFEVSAAFYKLDPDKLDKDAKDIESTIDEDIKEIESIKKVFKTFSSAINIANSVEEYFELMYSYLELNHLAEEMKAVLRKMYDLCPNDNAALKAALDDCVDVIDASYTELTAILIAEMVNVAGKEASTYLFGKLWDVTTKKLTYSHPAVAAIKVAYKASKYLSNVMFKTDASIEQYHKMCAIIEVKKLLVDAQQSLIGTFNSLQTSENAKSFLSSIDFMAAMQRMDNKEAIAYIKVLDSAVFSKIANLFSSNDHEKLKDSINSINASTMLDYRSLLVDWVFYLEDDYPESGLYEKYKYITEQTFDKKFYTIACPVDVYVYDTSNNLVASIVGGVVTVPEDSTVTAAVENDVKTLIFSDGKEYRIVYDGTGDGTMDINVVECDEYGEELRQINFFDIPLTSDSEYESNENGVTLKEEEYNITDSSNDNVIVADFDNFFESDTFYTITAENAVLSSLDDCATTLEACENDTLTATAIIPEGSVFTGWTSSVGTDIFADAQSPVTTLIVPASDVKINATYESAVTADSPTMLPDETQTLIVNEAFADNVTWTSSNEAVATIDSSGTVTTHALGTVVITATAGDASASCTIEVIPPIILKAMGGSVRIVEPYGLRFGIQLKKDDAYNQYKDIIVSYGTLIIPKKNLGNTPLTFDVEKAMDVPAVNIYGEDSTQLTYTGVLVGIPKSAFYSDIVGCGYLKYLDVDGNEKVIYTDEIVRSYYQVANSAYIRYGNITDRDATEQAVYEKLAALLAEMTA